MITVTLADLLFRARQFTIALLGVALVMTMALLLSGMANGFTVEVQRTVDGVAADYWVMANGTHGGLTAFAAFPESVATTVSQESGVGRADPFLLMAGQSTVVKGANLSYNLAGVVPGGLGDPTVAAGNGHGLEAPGEAVADVAAGASIGMLVQLGDRHFTVVGTVTDRTLIGGQPIIYVELPAAQTAVLGGRRLISSVVTVGAPTAVPAGLSVYTSAQVVTATTQKLSSAISSINNSRILMWLVAAIIVAALLYVAALERRRDFAILKALGSSSAKLFGSLVLEAVIVTLAAALVAEVLSQFMTFVFKQPVVIPVSAYLELPLLAVVVGMLASLVALRKATGADPAAAFS